MKQHSDPSFKGLFVSFTLSWCDSDKHMQTCIHTCTAGGKLRSSRWCRVLYVGRGEGVPPLCKIIAYQACLLQRRVGLQKKAH